MDLNEAQALLAAVGTDTAPTADQLSGARAAFIDAAKTAKAAGDKEALAAMLEAIKVTDLAIAEAKELEAKANEELEALVKDIPELSAEIAEPVEEQEPAQAAAPRVLSVAEAAQRLGLAPAQVERVEVIDRPTQTLTINGEEMNDATWSQMGDAFAKFSKSMLRGGRTTLATFRTEYDTRLSGKQGENTRIIDELSRRAGEEAVVASGGACSLAEPIRDQPMLASLARPIASALPTIGAGAGKVSFFAPVCLPQGGVAAWTTAQDEAVDPADDTTWKSCLEVDCADTQEVAVEAIYQCLTIGNFQQRFSSERWDAILHAAAATQARVAEVTLFNQIVNSPFTTAHTVADTGSVYATTVQSLLRAAATIKQNQRYDGRRMKAILPAWVKDAAEMDLLARAIKNGRSLDADSMELALARGGVDVIWSGDINAIEPNGQVDGPLSAFPAEFDAVLYVDGGVFRLDGGEINLGTEIRDHDLNRQNKVAAFAESFEAALVRSCDTKHLTIPVSICDDAPCTIVAPGTTADAPLYTSAISA